MKVSFRTALLTLSTAVLTMPCFAVVDPLMIPVAQSDREGTRSTPIDVIGSDGWTEANGGFKIKWTITFDAGIYKYVYEFMDQTASSGPPNPNLSHVIFEVSPSFTLANLKSGSTAPSNDGVKTYAPSDPGNSNPNLPAPIYGLKFDRPETTDNYIVTLNTDRAPVWGDFYAKGGNASTAWNSGFGTNPTLATTDFSGWVPTPDTLSGDPPEVPEPGTILFLASGLSMLALGRRLRRS